MREPRIEPADEAGIQMWKVQSDSRRWLWHKVSRDPETSEMACECEDYCWRGHACTHIKAVLRFEARLEEAALLLASRVLA